METLDEDSTPERENKVQNSTKEKSISWIEQLAEVIRQLNTTPSSDNTEKDNPETREER